ncbi:hypothetical protein BUPH_08450 (plasmid) [Paraburkholderia phenoliruptrix BR3459a]|uniref:Uncharacterized protein n=1 Tax=Paraburkholderia phenoliruptrix BR3459a TaxID=1229205 RepID=K0DVT6_9BURK|nr:hypothetical protein BUPH_08450 [Paraburkholderia phenoliruptrix BR3459a]
MLLIGLLTSYCCRRIYQDLLAPVRPVRHACRFSRNRDVKEDTVDLTECYFALTLSLLVNIAHAIRAISFARATAATLTRRRCLTYLIQRLRRSSRRFTKRITARAPCTQQGTKIRVTMFYSGVQLRFSNA